MASRVTQVWAEVLRSTATTTIFSVSGSTTITFSYTASEHSLVHSAGSTTITFTGTCTKNAALNSAGSTTITFSYTATENAKLNVSGSTLVLLSYVAAENSGINVAGSNTITFFASCSENVAAEASASTTVTFSDSSSQVAAFAVNSSTTITFSQFAYRDMDYAVSGSTTITFTGSGGGHKVTSSSAATTITFASLSFGDGKHGVGGGLLELSGVATSVKIVNDGSSATFTFTGSGSSVRDLEKNSQSNIQLSDSEGATRDLLVSATTQLRFRDNAVPLNKALGGNAMAANRVGYLGRYQLGQVVPLMIRTTGYQGRIVTPFDYPIATIFDSSANVVATVKLPAMDRGNSVFALPLFLSLKFSVGRFRVITTYASNGAYTGAFLDYFEIIPGGDPNGPLISLFAYDRPEASYVLAQMGSGKLAQGANPQI
jgi:hypothetical protein